MMAIITIGLTYMAGRGLWRSSLFSSGIASELEELIARPADANWTDLFPLPVICEEEEEEEEDETDHDEVEEEEE